MMANDEWSRWSELWKQQPVADEAPLRRAAARKRLRMQFMAVLELLTTAFAIGQLLRLWGEPSLRWRIWGALSAVCILALQALYLHIRRGTWRASGSDVRSMVELTIRRARAGIRLAHLNAWVTVVGAMATLIVAMPELSPTRWQHDAKLRLILIVQFAVNVPLILALIAFCAWYIRRQRQRIRHANVLLEQLQD